VKEFRSIVVGVDFSIALIRAGWAAEPG